MSRVNALVSIACAFPASSIFAVVMKYWSVYALLAIVRNAKNAMVKKSFIVLINFLNDYKWLVLINFSNDCAVWGI